MTFLLVLAGLVYLLHRWSKGHTKPRGYWTNWPNNDKTHHS